MDKSLMLRHIKDHLGIKKELDFADYLGIKQSTLATWHNRNTFDAELIISKCDFLDANWLLTGEGKMLKETNLSNMEETDRKKDNIELLKEKERFIQHLLKESENNIKNIADLKTKIEILTSKLEAAMEVIDIEKERNSSKKDQLKNEEKAGNKVQ